MDKNHLLRRLQALDRAEHMRILIASGWLPYAEGSEIVWSPPRLYPTVAHEAIMAMEAG